MQMTSWPAPRKVSQRGEPINPAPPVIRYLAINPSYRVVAEADFFEIRRIIDIATVENHRTLEQLLDPLKIRTTKLIPLRQDDQSRGAVAGIVVPLRILHLVAEDLPRFLGRFGIERLDPGACLQKRPDNGDRGGISHVVCARFEGES